jgi:hypothetical protein
LFRASTIWLAFNGVDGRPKPGHDRASLVPRLETLRDMGDAA